MQVGQRAAVHALGACLMGPRGAFLSLGWSAEFCYTGPRCLSLGWSGNRKESLTRYEADETKTNFRVRTSFSVLDPVHLRDLTAGASLLRCSQEEIEL